MRLLSLFICMLFVVPAWAQNAAPTDSVKTSKSLVKDPEDGHLDLSQWLIEADGFVPIVNLITEPALGGIGGMFAPMFLKQRKTKEGFIQPDITIAGAMYTGNNSWGVGAGRFGTIAKWKMKYRVGIGYTDINMDYYRTGPQGNEYKLGVNLSGVPILLKLSKQVGNTNIYLGGLYTFSSLKLSPKFNLSDELLDKLPNFIEDKDLKNIISKIGVTFELDKRNTIFTPDRGYRLSSQYSQSADWLGSDYNYGRFELDGAYFLPVGQKWVSGFHGVFMGATGDAPFFALPSVNMRGVPRSRYQGEQAYTLETEQRYDLTTRWSLLALGGVGKAPNKVSFSNADLVYSYGAGFRYLLAKAFGMRVGIDVAKSNHDWGWYITFGHAWNR